MGETTGVLTGEQTGKLTGRPTDGLTGWLTDWLIGGLTDGLTGGLTDGLTGSLIRGLPRSTPPHTGGISLGTAAEGSRDTVESSAKVREVEDGGLSPGLDPPLCALRPLCALCMLCVLCMLSVLLIPLTALSLLLVRTSSQRAVDTSSERAPDDIAPPSSPSAALAAPAMTGNPGSAAKPSSSRSCTCEFASPSADAGF